ncbi:MAG: BlaI/MecI/CopY family transcriptional regulator [Acidobacteriota bacterium]
MVWTPRDITETELDLLRALWRLGPSSIREITDQLYPDGGRSHYATVQSLLGRLEAKACVEREKQGRRNVFTASVSRGELVQRRLRETAESLCGGSLAPLLSPLVSQLADNGELDPEEIEALSRLIERLDDTSEGAS